MDKSVFNFKIQKKDGTVIDLHDKNLFVNSFRIISPDPEHIVDKVEGNHGSLYLGTVLNDRKISAKITVETDNYTDFDLFRDEIYRLFNPLEKFYIIRDLQPHKRVEVSVASEFDIDYIWLELGEFQIDFVIHSVFFESVGTTLNPEYTDGYTQVSTNEPVQYVFNQQKFSVWNEGDITVDPCIVPLVITFKGASEKLNIKNITNGTEWSYTGNTLETDAIILDGIGAFKNSKSRENSIFGQTNRKVISLEKGWNEFEITGATSPFEVSFDFRFYYI